MKKVILFIVIIIIISFVSYSQVGYKQMMKNDSVNFYDVCKAAEAYFSVHDKNVKGSGWKGYQRWKNANEHKFFPSGERLGIDPYFVSKSYDKFIKSTLDGVKINKGLFNNGWKPIGPQNLDSLTGHYSPGLGRVEDHYVDPNNANVMYLGSRSGGFWKSNNGGNSWEGGSTDFLVASGVNTIAVSPTNADSILINVRNSRNGNSHGIYRSVDGGDNWVESNFNPASIGFGGLGSNFKIYKIVYHPTVSNLVFIGTSKGIYRSEDNLQTWTRLINSGDISDIAFHPTNPDVIYIYNNYYWNANLDYVLRSTDRGQSYNLSSQIVGNNGNRSVHLSVSSACPSCLYFASDEGVWKSTDEGVNFTFLNNPNQACGGFAVNDLDTANMIYGYVDIERTINGGEDFEQVTWWSLGSAVHGGGGNQVAFNNSTNYVHADLHPAKCVNGVFYVGTDGLFCKSVDNGATWEVLSNGVSIRENYKLGVSQSNHYRSISGSQDNGTSIKHRNSWVEFYGADGMEGIIHPLNDDWMIGSVQFGNRRRTKDGGQTQDGPNVPNHSGSGNAAWEAPITYDPNNQMRVYNFSDSVFASDNFGSDWVYRGKPSSFTGNINQSAIAENNSDIIVISKSSSIDKSTDGGLTFTSIKNNLPSTYIEDIAFDPNNDDVIVVCYASYQNDNSKIYMTTNGGLNWSNITYNLGNMPIHSVVIDHSSESNIYLGAEIGVYTMSSGASSWSLYNTNLPNTTIEELEIVNGTNTLKAATWGRGLWEYSLVNRLNHPAILLTEISNQPTDDLPKENINQFVTSVISSDQPLSKVYLEWSVNSPVFGNEILMNNTQDSTWKSATFLPNYPAGTKMYFKVFAINDLGDTTETYKFMYTVKPYNYCETSGALAYNGNVTLVKFNTINKSSGKLQPYTNYSSTDSTVVDVNSSYDLTVNLNTDNGNYTYFSKAWVDWNHDADFDDPGESYELGSSTNVSDGITSLSPLNITVPSGALVGNTRMRVACRYNGYPDECDDNYDGEVEDYLVIVRDITASMEEPSYESVLAFPNPTEKIINLKFKKEYKQVRISLFDLAGRLVEYKEDIDTKFVMLDLSEESNGVYILQVTADDDIFNKIEMIKQ